MGFSYPFGASASFTNQALVDKGDHKHYAVAYAYSHWDRDQTLTIEESADGNAPWAAVDPTKVYWAAGDVYFAASQGTKHFRASGKCFTMVSIGGATEWDADVDTQIEDCTCEDNVDGNFARKIAIGLSFKGSTNKFWWVTQAQLEDANAIKLTAIKGGRDGNDLTWAVVISGTNTPLSAAIVGDAITVHSATGGTGLATSTVQEVIDAVNAVVSIPVTAELGTGGDGDAIVVAVTLTYLAGGVDSDHLDDLAEYILIEGFLDKGASKKRFVGYGAVDKLNINVINKGLIKDQLSFQGDDALVYIEG